MPKKRDLPPFPLSEVEVEVAWAALSAAVRDNDTAVRNMRPSQRKVAAQLYERMTCYLIPAEEDDPELEPQSRGQA